MPFDLQTAEIAVTVVMGLLTIVGTILGWFGSAWRWMSSVFKRNHPVGVIDVPSKTMILIPVLRDNALWWHMGTMGNQPVMQIVGDLNITNIYKYGVFVMGTKLRKKQLRRILSDGVTGAEFQGGRNRL